MNFFQSTSSSIFIILMMLNHIQRPLQLIFKIVGLGVAVMAQWLTNPTRNHEVAGSIPGLTQARLKIRRCRELWCRLQAWLGSCVAVAVA